MAANLVRIRQLRFISSTQTLLHGVEFTVTYRITLQRLENDDLTFGCVLRTVMGCFSRTFDAFVCHIEHAMLDRRVEIDLFLTPPFYWLSKLERVHNWSERC